MVKIASSQLNQHLIRALHRSMLKQVLMLQMMNQLTVSLYVVPMYTFIQKDSFSGIILNDIGFARPASQDVNEFAIKGATKEQIPDMDGDILFYFTYDKGDGEGMQVEDEWINDPLFQNLSVAKAGKVYKVADDIWNTAGGVRAANLMLDDIEKFFLQQ
jgi:iron complex transport system substrate-binding protein